jgi:hypothetical protein
MNNSRPPWQCIQFVIITRETFRGGPRVKGEGAFQCQCLSIVPAL